MERELTPAEIAAYNLAIEKFESEAHPGNATDLSGVGPDLEERLVGAVGRVKDTGSDVLRKLIALFAKKKVEMAGGSQVPNINPLNFR